MIYRRTWDYGCNEQSLSSFVGTPLTSVSLWNNFYVVTFSCHYKLSCSNSSCYNGIFNKFYAVFTLDQKNTVKPTDILLLSSVGKETMADNFQVKWLGSSHAYLHGDDNQCLCVSKYLQTGIPENVCSPLDSLRAIGGGGGGGGVNGTSYKRQTQKTKSRDHMISAAELIRHFLPRPLAPGCSTSRLNNAEDLLLLRTRLCREPPPPPPLRFACDKCKVRVGSTPDSPDGLGDVLMLSSSFEW